MVNAVMDAIALLSSLATDLDIMLNDLRESPARRGARAASIEQQQQQQQQHRHQLNHHQVSYQQQQQQHQLSQQQHFHLQQQQQQQQQPQHWNFNMNESQIAKRSKPSTATSPSQTNAQQQQQQQQQQRFYNRRRYPRTSSHERTTIPCFMQTKPTGLSPEVKNLQKLPLLPLMHSSNADQRQKQQKQRQYTSDSSSCQGGGVSPKTATPPTRRLVKVQHKATQEQRWQGRRSKMSSSETTTLAKQPMPVITTTATTTTTTTTTGESRPDESKVEVIVYTKSDKTLKYNMNAKDETLRKRTSLIIVPQLDNGNLTIDGSAETMPIETQQRQRQHSASYDHFKIDNAIDNSNRNSVTSVDSCVSRTTTASDSSTSVEVDVRKTATATIAVYQQLQNSHNEDGDDDDDHHQQQRQRQEEEDEHCNNLNMPMSSSTKIGGGGNSTSLSSSASSSASSASSSSTLSTTSSSPCSVDYSLREKLKNLANRDADIEKCKKNDLPTAMQLLRSMQQQQPLSNANINVATAPTTLQPTTMLNNRPHCDTLLSPQEVPMGRRYAEVTQFKSMPVPVMPVPVPVTVTVSTKRTNELNSLSVQQLAPGTHNFERNAVCEREQKRTDNNISSNNNNNNNNNNNSNNNNNNNVTGVNNNPHLTRQQRGQFERDSYRNNEINRNSLIFGDGSVVSGGGGGGGAVGMQNLNFDLGGGDDDGSTGNLNEATQTTTSAAAAAAAAGGVGAATAAGGMDGAGQQFNHTETQSESSCCGDIDGDESGTFDDEMQALLPPKCSRHSRDELSQSRTSLVSSSEGGILAEGETSSESSHETRDASPSCELSLGERLLHSHPVWFLPGIQRSGAVHFLQGKEEGTFIVRGSSQPKTMAVSVRLPPDTGPYIEHYLIQSNDGILSLESSRFKFDSIPALIAHYAQCCDELPVQLLLPQALREAKNRQQLSSLALLGQEFWRYAVQNATTTTTAAAATTTMMMASAAAGSSNKDALEAQLLDAKSPNSLTETSGLGTATFFSESAGGGVGGGVGNASLPIATRTSPNVVGAAGGRGGCFIGVPTAGAAAASTVFSPTGSYFSQAGTPSDTTSSMSSFTTSGGQHMQLMSPESVDSVILTMSPVDGNSQRSGILACHPLTGSGGRPFDVSNNLSTFKTTTTTPGGMGMGMAMGSVNSIESTMGSSDVRPQRPKPPNTLNLDLNVRKPPAPPLRWSKAQSPHGPAPPPPQDHHVINPQTGNGNFTVTTTVTFSVDAKNKALPPPPMPTPTQFLDVTKPAANHFGANATTLQTFAKRLSPEGECKDTISSQGSSSNDSRWLLWQASAGHDANNIILPHTAATPTSTTGGGGGGGGGKSRKAKARKESESQHYQESAILESSQIYCRSTLLDKLSDYEDVWPSDRTSLLTSFKPASTPATENPPQFKRPDLLDEMPNALITPTNSQSNLLLPTAESDAAADTQNLLQGVYPCDALPSPPRSRAGLLLPLSMSQSLTDDQFMNTKALLLPPECDKTNPDVGIGGNGEPVIVDSRHKQSSPFYAEPADALNQASLNTASILRRSQRNQHLPASHRHSEPLKGGATPIIAANPQLASTDSEKIAGSLDELKKQKPTNQTQQPSKRARNREHWQLDSSWEFMAKQQDESLDYDLDAADWHAGNDTMKTHMHEKEKENTLTNEATLMQKEVKPRPLTIHQIIAKRFPDLNLPEVVRCSTPPQQQQQQQQLSQPLQPQCENNKLSSLSSSVVQNELGGSQKSFQSQNGCRLSSYDNVERNCAAFCQTYFNGIDSAQSDDGTVFSEPWDSSQWDALMPQDDATIQSETIHLSKCPPAVSEDDTIIEELSSMKGSSCNQDTLKPHKINGKVGGACRPKVATILRNPSMRDREILCHPRNKINVYSSGPGDSVRAYTLQLALDQKSTFARNIENFISCTKESREAAPQVVMRNMRQFMNGMKNYLVKHGEGKFQQEVELARSRLKSDEFLNLDAILETVMHQLVVLPLREHLYGMFVDYYTRSEAIQALAQNVKYACGRSAVEFGIPATVSPPSSASLNIISNLLLRLQEAELPLDKLDIFLCVISTIYEATHPRGQQLSADDLLPVLVYVVAKCGFVGAEIEAEFMWGLLQQTLLNGEPGYYLTALCSAVHVLKSFKTADNESGTGTGSLDWRSSQCMPACSSVLRVIIPDECNGSLQTRTLPVRPHTTTKDVCRIIAHKARITNPQDYALFKLVDGEETLLTDAECPQDVRLAAKGKHCMLAYKRIDAKIAWPTTATSASASMSISTSTSPASVTLQSLNG